MMRGRATVVLVIAVALLGALALVAALAPATWVAPLVAKQSNGAVTLTDAQGTLWNGRGTAVLGGGRWSAPVRWTLSPWSLLRGRVDLALAPRDTAGLPAQVTADTHGYAVAATTFTLPASALLGSLRQVLPVSLGGDVTFTTPGAALRDGATAGEVNVQWQGARVADAAGRVLDFGSINTTLRARGAGFSGALANTGGDATLAGDITVGAAGSAIDVTVTSRTATPPPLLQTLALFGTQLPGGGTRLRWQSGAR